LTVIAIPNISEGRDQRFIDATVTSVQRGACDVLDVHSDGRHNRTVLTIASADDSFVEAMIELASLASTIDMTRHTGVHPRLGGLDVCPFVPFRTDMEPAVTTAREVGRAISERCDLPVYLYGHAAPRASTRRLPDLRRGGLQELIARAPSLPPDFGPGRIDPSKGVVCVGARGPLIAFNVWIEAPVKLARAIAHLVREENSGLAGLRALGLEIGNGRSQVSMNITEPDLVGIDAAYEAVANAARAHGVAPVHTELVGLVEQRFAPDPEKEAARLLIQPGRTLESALKIA
jgi:glutamate formiminotransferase